MKKISVIIPTYNEAGNIIPLIVSIRKSVRDLLEIIVVDDNSPDGTARLAKRWSNNHHAKQSVRVIVRLSEHGLTNSISEGIRMAQGDIILWMDADFSHPPTVINSLTAAIEKGADIAVASRYVLGGKPKSDTTDTESAAAIKTSSLANTSMRYIFSVPFYDFTSGFIAVKKEVIRALPLRGSYGEYFIHLIVQAFARNFRVVEIPFTSVPRHSGTSKTVTSVPMLFKRISQYGMMIIHVVWETRIHRNRK